MNGLIINIPPNLLQHIITLSLQSKVIILVEAHSYLRNQRALPSHFPKGTKNLEVSLKSARVLLEISEYKNEGVAKSLNKEEGNEASF